ncbi:MAG: hypothetical protein KAS02_00045 [Candidatus Pacebacteria bacterium]|nr:hypothetical protein [Candidatus Paceibacterota bacterium]
MISKQWRRLYLFVVLMVIIYKHINSGDPVQWILLAVSGVLLVGSFILFHIEIEAESKDPVLVNPWVVMFSLIMTTSFYLYYVGVFINTEPKMLINCIFPSMCLIILIGIFFIVSFIGEFYLSIALKGDIKEAGFLKVLFSFLKFPFVLKNIILLLFTMTVPTKEEKKKTTEDIADKEIEGEMA